MDKNNQNQGIRKDSIPKIMHQRRIQQSQNKTPMKIWRNPIFIVILMGVLVAAVYGNYGNKSEILDQAEYSQNGRQYRVQLEKKSTTKRWKGEKFLKGRSLDKDFVLGKEIAIYEKEEKQANWQEIKRYDFESVGAWCVAMGQMDENPDIEVFVGAYRPTRHFPEGPRPYLFSWDFQKQELLRLWTGSYLDAPVFLQADFQDSNGDGYDEIRLIEKDWLGEEEKNYITYYSYLRNMFQPVKIKRETIDK